MYGQSKPGDVIGAMPVADDVPQYQPPDETRVTNEELMERMNWSAEDYVAARDLHGLPKADALRAQVFDHSGAGEPLRLVRFVNEWIDTTRARAHEMLRLIGEPIEPKAPAKRAWLKR